MEIDIFGREYVGMNKNTIKKYIQNQEFEDQINDKRSLKEYKDPLKGK